MNRCWGLTTNLRRCGRFGDWRFFCDDHKKQPIIWIVFLIFTVGGGSASLYQCLKPSSIVTIKEVEQLFIKYHGIKLENPPVEEVKSEIERELKIAKNEALKLYEKGDEAYKKDHYKESIIHFKTALNIIKIPAFYISLSNCYVMTGEDKKLLVTTQKALKLYRDSKNRRVEGNALLNLGIAYRRLEQFDKSKSFCEQALTIARAVGNRETEGLAVNALGNIYLELNQSEKAIGFYQQGLAIARKSDDRNGEQTSLGNMGLAYYKLGKAEKAIGIYEQALNIARDTDSLKTEGSILGNMGTAYYELGNIEKAIGLYNQALTIMRKVGNRNEEGITLASIGNAYYELGNIEKAIGFFEQYLIIAREFDNRKDRRPKC